MAASEHNRRPLDRRDDTFHAAAGRFKPPILRRGTLHTLCLASLALIVYGTLGPLGLRGGPWLTAPEDWHWLPGMEPTSRNDLITNVLVYIPVGVALRLLLRRRGHAGVGDLSLALVLAVGLSYVTELLQQCMPARSSSLVDVIVNSCAALMGCIAAPSLQRIARRLHQMAFWHWQEHPWYAVAWAMTALTAYLMMFPLDLTWPAIETDPYRQLDLLDFRRAAAFGMLGFAITMAMIERIGPGREAIGEAVKRIFVCGVLLEFTQIFIESHACSLLEIGTALFGGIAGCGAARWLAGVRVEKSDWLSRGRRAFALVLLLATLGFSLVSGVLDGGAGQGGSIGVRVLWVPLQTQFLQPFDRVVIETAESLFVYASLTMLCLYLTSGDGRRLALLLLAGLVGVVQGVRVLFLREAVDVTPVLIALVAWVVTVRCWRAFLPRGRERRAGVRPVAESPA